MAENILEVVFSLRAKWIKCCVFVNCCLAGYGTTAADPYSGYGTTAGYGSSAADYGASAYAGYGSAAGYGQR